jgi:hypothetical protein
MRIKGARKISKKDVREAKEKRNLVVSEEESSNPRVIFSRS